MVGVVLVDPRQMDWAFVIGQSLGFSGHLDDAEMKDRFVRQVTNVSSVNPGEPAEGIAIDAFESVVTLGKRGDLLDDYFFEVLGSARMSDAEAEGRVVDGYSHLARWLSHYGLADYLPSETETPSLRDFRWQQCQDKGLASDARCLLQPMREYFVRYRDAPRLFPRFIRADPRY
jgi:hypothetical protein